jgi:DMSO/TMAO reductase YedYZ molybdopterin-dependent catalytic subunit
MVTERKRRPPRPTRRGLLTGIAATAGAGILAGCNQLDMLAQQGSWFRDSVLHLGEDFNRTVQRFFLRPDSLAREFTEADISTDFKANGSTDPDDPAYRAMAASGFADWKLEVGGLVERPMSFSLADLRAMPSRTQITRHDCVEGWSCIGKWTGVPLALVLEQVHVKPQGRFVMFTCADQLEQTLDGTGRYYETLGFEDAYHPQTILAYDMNGETLTVPHGAPLRVRVERQLGYKMAKYVMKIDVIDDYSSVSRGNGGFWEDRGYDWYAGI